jgi:hypothetical protein
MRTIVTSTYRYRRPPGKRKPVEIEGPRIVTPADPKKARRHVAREAAEDTSDGAEPPRVWRGGNAINHDTAGREA